MFTGKITMDYYTKHNVSEQEYKMHSVGERLGYAPRIISYNAAAKTLTTELIKPMCIADMYGDKASDVPPHIWPKIKKIVSDLYRHGFEYVDITGYNFIEDSKQRVWIVDFGHCRPIGENHEPNAFVHSFIHNASFIGWNPDFK